MYANEAPDTGRFMTKVYDWMFLGLGVSGLVAYYTQSNLWLLQAVLPFAWIIALVEVGVAHYISSRALSDSLDVSSCKIAYIVYCALTGLTLAPLAIVYGEASVTEAFITAAVAFGGLSITAHFIQQELGWLTKGLVMTLVGLLVAMVLNIWLRHDGLDLLISVVAVLLFSVLTIYDTKKIQQLGTRVGGNPDSSLAIFGAFSLYLDFINLFIHLVKIIAKLKEKGNDDRKRRRN